ncbi:MAG: hypothetical protein DDT23_00984 [candidate division WS2 bacterium]|nr:hypothetical protein [Candidatus Lithacetigena glycinireducens]
MLIKKGSMVLMSYREYPDLKILALVKINKNIETDEICKEYLLERPEEKEMYRFQSYRFVKWFVDKKYGDEIEYVEWFVGAYGILGYK